jgi:general secretion pathway protein F
MRFALKAVDGAQQVVALELDAADETSARELARQKGFAVLVVRQRGLALRAGRPFPTTLFSLELLALLEAGLNIVEALQTLVEKESPGPHRRVLADLLDGLHRGESFSRSIARFPDAFPPLYIATLRSSEQTGNVREALSRYIAYREELDRVRKKVVAALLYPSILVAVGSLVFAFLLFYVVPRFARVYEGISTELPFFSWLLLAVGRWIEGNSVPLALCFVLAGIGAAYAASRADFRAALLRALWRVPSLGERMRVYQLARFYRTVGMLLRAGVPALRALQMVADLLPPALRTALARAAVLIQEGRPLSATLTTAGLATPVATRMLAVGEQSGQVGELMDRIARFYDDETGRYLEAFTRVFEPLLMAVLGLAVGGVVVLMYMPIFELAGSLK